MSLTWNFNCQDCFDRQRPNGSIQFIIRMGIWTISQTIRKSDQFTSNLQVLEVPYFTLTTRTVRGFVLTPDWYVIIVTLASNFVQISPMCIERVASIDFSFAP
jgi:hypothetical protein